MAFLQQVVFWSVSCAYLKSRKIDSSQQPQLLLSLVAPLFFLIILCISGWLLRGSFFANLPSVLGYLALVEAVNFPHHLGLPRISGERSLMLWQQYKVSRTCIYRSWFCKYVLLNFNYHSEHHMFPSLPWRELPRAYRLVQEMRPSDYNSHNGHVWILQNRRLDLTDVIGSTSLPEFIENKAEIAA
jgi:fatty acid desaturase